MRVEGKDVAGERQGLDTFAAACVVNVGGLGEWFVPGLSSLLVRDCLEPAGVFCCRP